MAEQFIDERVAVVTGASSGFGQNIVRELAARDWTTVGLATREDRLAALAEEVGGEYEVCDITDPAQVEIAAGRILDRHENIGLLVNSAGMAMRERLAGVGPEEAEKVIATNYLGSLRVVRALQPGLEASGGADIVDIVSAAATIDNPNSGPYSVSKAAQLAASRMLRADLRPSGIAVHSVLPGKAHTEGHPQKPSSSPLSKLTRTDVEAVTAVVLDRVGRRPSEVYVPRILKAIGVINGIAPVTAGRIIDSILG